VLPVGVHSTPLFSHPEGPDQDQVAHEGISLLVGSFGCCGT
jgi:hypothetical protein